MQKSIFALLLYVIFQIEEFVESAVSMLVSQNALLSAHPNSSLYSCLSQLVSMDGYYLESEPCLVCNNPELPFISIKLSTIKVRGKMS